MDWSPCLAVGGDEIPIVQIHWNSLWPVEKLLLSKKLFKRPHPRFATAVIDYLMSVFKLSAFPPMKFFLAEKDTDEKLQRRKKQQSCYVLSDSDLLNNQESPQTSHVFMLVVLLSVLVENAFIYVFKVPEDL